MENEIEPAPTIECLPNEVLLLILQYNNCHEIISFGSTCKRFHEMIKCSTKLWKEEFKKNFPSEMFKSVKDHCNGAWLEEVMKIYKLRKQVYSEIIKLSSLLFRHTCDISIEDVKHFFTIATESNLRLCYVIYILQDLIKKGYKVIDNQVSRKPFTLTEMYYAKVILRYLIHGYLAMKWARLRVRKELPPEIVVNYFLQWVDNEHIHSDDIMNDKLEELVDKVHNTLDNKNTSIDSSFSSMTIQERCAKGLLLQENIINAITQVIYRQRHMAVTTTANLQTLDIVKALKNKVGNAIVVASIYQAVARKCGVRCQLVAFPNHMFLEWRPNWNDPNSPAFTIDLNNGELKRKGQCPFSQNRNNVYEYDPDALLHSIYTSFRITMGFIDNWNTQNALLLLDILGVHQGDQNIYRRFFLFLYDNMNEHDINTPLDYKYMDIKHLQTLMLLPSKSVPTKPFQRDVIIKRRDGRVLYAVGMICYHVKLNYVCIIRGWDPTCQADWMDRISGESHLYFGINQPFYHVVAVDQSQRYVAEENLKNIQRPTRLYHLEDIIAREFTHFDGFSYVPNDEKRLEYPDDEAITATYEVALLRTYSSRVTQI
ncbi:F-box only protein 21 [Aphomia sociella]